MPATNDSSNGPTGLFGPFLVDDIGILRLGILDQKVLKVIDDGDVDPAALLQGGDEEQNWSSFIICCQPEGVLQELVIREAFLAESLRRFSDVDR